MKSLVPKVAAVGSLLSIVLVWAGTQKGFGLPGWVIPVAAVAAVLLFGLAVKMGTRQAVQAFEDSQMCHAIGVVSGRNIDEFGSTPSLVLRVSPEHGRAFRSTAFVPSGMSDKAFPNGTRVSVEYLSNMVRTVTILEKVG